MYAKNPHFGFLEKIKWKNANSIFQDFMNSNVVTTVDTMTAPLSEVYFPSAVVCNINQVSEHFFRFFVNESLQNFIYFWNTRHFEIHALCWFCIRKIRILSVSSSINLLFQKFFFFGFLPTKYLPIKVNKVMAQKRQHQFATSK